MTKSVSLTNQKSQETGLAFPFTRITLFVFAMFLAGCATDTPKTGHYKVGTPYQISGVWYYPKEDPFYDETGVASWYGSDFHGKSTANGEKYDMDGLTAAHRTLPLPSIVRVTNLSNGRSIKLRVNDRGPYARGRIIDVSRTAAKLLGFQGPGTARVRVQFESKADLRGGGEEQMGESTVGASEIRAAPLSPILSSTIAPPAGATASEPATALARTALQTPPPIVGQAKVELEPDGAVSNVPVPAVTELWVQVGAFVTRSNAERLVSHLSTVGKSQILKTQLNGKSVYRVRFGPYAAVDEADSMLDKVISAGQNGAQIIVE